METPRETCSIFSRLSTLNDNLSLLSQNIEAISTRLIGSTPPSPISPKAGDPITPPLIQAIHLQLDSLNEISYRLAEQVDHLNNNLRKEFPDQ